MHHPVLTQEVVEIFRPVFRGAIVDATFGGGGHTEALLGAGAKFILGVDRDPVASESSRRIAERYADRFRFAPGIFSQLDRIVEKNVDPSLPILGILMDLGLSSMQIDNAERGFSFASDGPLDMRMNPSAGKSAAEFLATVAEEDLIEILKNYGDVRDPKPVARSILFHRTQSEMSRTSHLKSAVFKGLPGKPYRYAFRTTVQVFQSIRIAVNKELEELAEGLRAGWKVLDKGGRMVALSYHSGEDRTVKQFFASRVRQEIARLVLDKPKVPGTDEVRKNPRARSAKMRAVEKIV